MAVKSISPDEVGIKAISSCHPDLEVSEGGYKNIYLPKQIILKYLFIYIHTHIGALNSKVQIKLIIH